MQPENYTPRLVGWSVRTYPDSLELFTNKADAENAGGVVQPVYELVEKLPSPTKIYHPEGHQWCQPGDTQGKRHYLIRFDDAYRSDIVMDDWQSARDAYALSVQNWNCWMFATVPVSELQRPLDVRQVLADFQTKMENGRYTNVSLSFDNGSLSISKDGYADFLFYEQDAKLESSGVGDNHLYSVRMPLTELIWLRSQLNTWFESSEV